MEVIKGYDSSEGRFTLLVSTNLLEIYFNNFSGLMKNNISNTVPDLRVKRIDSSKALVSFPLPKESSVSVVNSERAVVSMPTDLMNRLDNVINKFAKMALKKKLKSTEFIPLSGYPIEDLRKDVKEAIKGKRNFCIIKTYEDYLVMDKSKDPKLEFDQVYILYGTEEYFNICLSILFDDNLSKLENELSPRFKKKNWI